MYIKISFGKNLCALTVINMYLNMQSDHAPKPQGPLGNLSYQLPAKKLALSYQGSLRIWGHDTYFCL